MTTSVRFNNLSALVGMDRHFGSLSVERGRLTFSPGGLFKFMGPPGDPMGPIVHTERVVRVARARFALPNMNSAIRLVGTAQFGASVTAEVYLPAWTRPGLCRALSDAGFEIDLRVGRFRVAPALRQV
ncbi:MAG: hypothetical protein R2749_01405 [Acidimicrobiales bacterium]